MTWVIRIQNLGMHALGNNTEFLNKFKPTLFQN